MYHKLATVENTSEATKKSEMVMFRIQLQVTGRWQKLPLF